MVLERQMSATEREMVKELARRRQRITFARDPIKVLSLFAWVCADAARSFVDWLVHHRRTGLYPLITLIAAYAIAAAVPGAHTPYLDEIRVDAEFVVWWVGLGVLSSIGLGTGMHSGLLFLFPHILKVCRSAEACGAVGFDTRANMWFAMGGDDLFACESSSDVSAPATWLNVWLACLPAAVLWGGGTAAGEIPPYYISLLAARAGKENEELLELEEEETETMTAIQRKIHDWKVWMIDFMKTHGFWGLVAMSAWPNAAFDPLRHLLRNVHDALLAIFRRHLRGQGAHQGARAGGGDVDGVQRGAATRRRRPVAGAFPEGWGSRFSPRGRGEGGAQGGIQGKGGEERGGGSHERWCLEALAELRVGVYDHRGGGVFRGVVSGADGADEAGEAGQGTRRSRPRHAQEPEEKLGTPSKKFE